MFDAIIEKWNRMALAQIYVSLMNFIPFVVALDNSAIYHPKHKSKHLIISVIVIYKKKIKRHHLYGT